MSTNTVLITGANGFIGRTLMRHLEAQGVPVIGVDLQGDGDAVHAGDVADPESWGALLDRAQVVVHTAALVTNALPDP